MCGHLAIELINGLEVTSQENLGSNSWRKFKRCVYDSIWLYCNIAIQFRKYWPTGCSQTGCTTKSCTFLASIC